MSGKPEQPDADDLLKDTEESIDHARDLLDEMKVVQEYENELTADDKASGADLARKRSASSRS